MKNGGIKTIKIKWKIVSMHLYTPIMIKGGSLPPRQSFKVKWDDKGNNIYCSQTYPYYWSFAVKEWDSVNIHLNEKNPKIYYIDDDFIVNKFWVSDDTYKTGFIRFISSFLFLLLLVFDVFMLVTWIQSLLDAQRANLISGVILVWIWILTLRLIIYLFQLIWGKKKTHCSE